MTATLSYNDVFLQETIASSTIESDNFAKDEHKHPNGEIEATAQSKAGLLGCSQNEIVGYHSSTLASKVMATVEILYGSVLCGMGMENTFAQQFQIGRAEGAEVSTEKLRYALFLESQEVSCCQNSPQNTVAFSRTILYSKPPLN